MNNSLIFYTGVIILFLPVIGGFFNFHSNPFTPRSVDKGKVLVHNFEIMRKEFEQAIDDITEEIESAFIGKNTIIRTLLIGFFGNLSVLIEDIPGVGKTTLAKSLAAASGLDFGRIQFTPDLLPGDIVGMNIWNQEKREFVFRKGSIMHQFVLADEINRSSERTQAALLEAMQEESVTVDGVTYSLKKPFFLIATQNPPHYAGTFRLPEAQLDRFGISFSIGYPDSDDEIRIIDTYKERDPLQFIKPVVSPERILEIRKAVRDIYVDPKIKSYLTGIAGETRKSTIIRIGMSPRATLHLLIASQAQAFLAKRDYLLPEDILYVAPYVLSHRLTPSSNARMEKKPIQNIVRELLGRIPLPTGLE